MTTKQSNFLKIRKRINGFTFQNAFDYIIQEGKNKDINLKHIIDNYNSCPDSNELHIENNWKYQKNDKIYINKIDVIDYNEKGNELHYTDSISIVLHKKTIDIFYYIDGLDYLILD